VPPRFGL